MQLQNIGRGRLHVYAFKSMLQELDVVIAVMCSDVAWQNSGCNSGDGCRAPRP